MITWNEYPIDIFIETDLEWGYGCDVKQFEISLGNCEVKKVTGEHEKGKDLKDVKFLNISTKETPIFPQGLKIHLRVLRFCILTCLDCAQLQTKIFEVSNF